LTEAQWLAGVEVGTMLAYLAGPDSSQMHLPAGRRAGRLDRKLRLFACACVRQVGPLLTDPRNRRALEAAERSADGSGTAEEIQTGTWLSQRVYEGVRRAEAERVLRLVRLVGGPLPRPEGEDALPVPPADAGGPPALVSPAQASLLRCVVGNPFRPQPGASAPCPHCRGRGEVVVPDPPGIHSSFRPATEPCRYCRRGKVAVPRPWLTPAAAGMAARVYDENDFSPAALGVLADLLEESGCQEESILRHLRGWARCPDCLGGGDGAQVYCEGCAGTGRLPPVHAKGCWVVDLLTGRE
jgi:hypothetical protein